MRRQPTIKLTECKGPGCTEKINPNREFCGLCWSYILKRQRERHEIVSIEKIPPGRRTGWQ